MAVTMKQMSVIVTALGVASFIFGIVAENKKPPSGTPTVGTGVIICKYQSDHTILLGFLSFGFLAASSAAGLGSVFYPFKGKSIPYNALFRNTTFTIFFNITLGLVGMAAAFVLWPTLTELHHRVHNLHDNLKKECPTAKTGLIGGGGVLSFCSSLFWLISLMLTDNVREDYFEEMDPQGVMAATIKQMSIIVATLGTLSFMFGVIAENKKPDSGTATLREGVVICKYSSDPTVVLGYLSVAFLVASTVAGYLSLFYPYKGRSIPQAALFRSTSFLVFFNIALGMAGLAAAMLLWPTITEQLHLIRNVHHNLNTTCPTAKTGLLGGGAFIALDASLFWLVSLMLADNVREDYFETVEKDPKGEQSEVLTNEYSSNVPVKGIA
uniref:Uncharacterized protein n=1 Tax=Vitis vinifera TaxID=29760 RepID=F6H2X2_VITVI